MKFIIENPKTSVASFFRQAGYSFQRQENGKMAFVRKLTHQLYPRFHLFVKVVDYNFEINIHIDHKAASHEGSRAHSGEYGEDSELLEREVGRLRSFDL